MPANTDVDQKRVEQPAAQPKAPARKQSWLRQHPFGAAIGLIVLLAMAVGAFLWLRYSNTYESTDDAQIEGHLNDVGSRIAGTVTAVHVVENQIVNRGDLLVELDPRDYAVEVAQAKASLVQAQAQVQVESPAVPITQNTSSTRAAAARANIASAEAAVLAARRDYEAQLSRVAQEEANNQKAQADLQRYSILVSKDEVSRQDYDQRVAAAKAAAAAVESARSAGQAAERIIEQRQAAVAQARSQLEQVTSNAPQELAAQRATVELKRAGVQVARTALEGAQLNLTYVKITAPVSGVVGRKAAEVGMHVQEGQSLLAIVPLDDIWVTANFKETQLRRMHAGLGATIHVDAFGRDYEGYVESIPPGTSALFSVLPPENASGNYVKVVQRLPVRLRFKPGQDAGHELRPGMSVVPKVWLK